MQPGFAKGDVPPLQQYPDVANRSTSRYYNKYCLKSTFFNIACGWVLSGLLEDTEASELKELLESRVKRLHFRPPRVRAAEPWQLMRQHRLFAPLSKDALLEIEKVSDCPLLVILSLKTHDFTSNET